ncbi:MAG TPA: glycosyltransferase [Bacteroidia bacterium]|nr:glycosyltransferase [Bacteroidia bacterium]
MKVLLLSDTSSEHTEKWALGLANSGLQVGLFSFNKAGYDWYNHPNITIFFEPEKRINAENMLTKLSYIKYVNVLKKIIRHFKPDILHAHYATSYGLVGALSGFKPFVLSVWGADVYDFPTRSKIHKSLFQYNIRQASLIMSTSEIMKNEIVKYTHKDVLVTPFGVDTTEFSNRPNPEKESGIVYIGTIKPMEEKYGIIHIIEAAQILLDERKDANLRFMLIGGGTEIEKYRRLISEKKLDPWFRVLGRIPFSEISKYHNLLDIFLNVSIDDSESFGVACVEAMSCEKPVIVSDVGGLMEVVNKGEFGKVIPKKDSKALAAAIEHFIDHPAEATALGKKARQNVIRHYDWNNNLRIVIEAYDQILAQLASTKVAKTQA